MGNKLISTFFGISYHIVFGESEILTHIILPRDELTRFCPWPLLLSSVWPCENESPLCSTSKQPLLSPPFDLCASFTKHIPHATRKSPINCPCYCRFAFLGLLLFDLCERWRNVDSQMGQETNWISSSFIFNFTLCVSMFLTYFRFNVGLYFL